MDFDAAKAAVALQWQVEWQRRVSERRDCNSKPNKICRKCFGRGTINGKRTGLVVDGDCVRSADLGGSLRTVQNKGERLNEA
jgi:hypothetical protein